MPINTCRDLDFGGLYVTSSVQLLGYNVIGENLAESLLLKSGFHQWSAQFKHIP